MQNENRTAGQQASGRSRRLPRQILAKRIARLVVGAVAVGLIGCGGSGGGSGRAASAADELPVGCLVKPHPGSCGGTQTGFYYDYRDNRCKPFAHGGCGSQVPFQTLQACRDFCGAEG